MSRYTDDARADLGKDKGRLVPDNPPRSADRGTADGEKVLQGRGRDVQAGPPLTGAAARADRQLHGQEGIGRVGAMHRPLEEKARLTPWHYVGGIVFVLAIGLILWYWMT